MPILLIAVILGLVEGVTEFLPVSSTGHLILVSRFLDFEGPAADAFDVFIQLGAILAVVVCYRTLFGSVFKPPSEPGFSGTRGLVLLAITTVPALVAGLLAHGTIKAHLFTPFTVAIGLAVGGVWILVTEQVFRHKNPGGLEVITWRTALYVGLFQCLALWPGMSRSTCTILGGMLVGLDRRSATEYSFFAAVPIMFAAVGYDLLKSMSHLHASDLPVFATGFAVSFFCAWASIRFLLHYVSRHSFKLFGWYRLALAGLVFALMR
ncbi:MAG TPA: undecaprenyl-diphosphate phosphatase [Kiritimatiellia bacterium]|jgi:undecaprenyl-diphosphatase